jgi:hypothetical protein
MKKASKSFYFCYGELALMRDKFVEKNEPFIHRVYHVMMLVSVI